MVVAVAQWCDDGSGRRSGAMQGSRGMAEVAGSRGGAVVAVDQVVTEAAGVSDVFFKNID